MTPNPDPAAAPSHPTRREGTRLAGATGAREAVPRALHAGVFLFGVLMLFRVFNHKLLLGDEGVSSLNAWRILSGQVPGRDFFEIIPPFSFLPTALSFGVFGVNLLAERLVALVWGILLLLGTDLLLKVVEANRWARLTALSVLVPYGVAYWPIPSHHWAADVLQLFAMLFLIEGLRTPRAFPLGLSGALASLSCFSLQDQGGYLVVAMGVLVFPWIRPWSTALRSSAAWACGGLAGALPFILWLGPRVPMRSLLDQWVVFPSTAYRGIPGHSLGIWGGFEAVLAQWSSQVLREQFFYSVTLTATSIFLLALPFVALAAALLAYLRRWRPVPELGVLTAGTSAAIATCAHRWALTNLVWAAPTLLVLAMLAGSHGWDAHRRGLRWAARACCLLLAGSALTFAAIVFRYASKDFTAPIATPAGTLRTDQYGQAKLVQETVDALDRYLQPGAPLVTDGFMGGINFLALRPNPTRFNFLFHPGFHRDEHAREVLAVLERRPDTAVLLAQPVLKSRPFQVWVLSRYRAVWSNRFAVLCLPPNKAQVGAPPPARENPPP